MEKEMKCKVGKFYRHKPSGGKYKCLALTDFGPVIQRSDLGITNRPFCNSHVEMDDSRWDEWPKEKVKKSGWINVYHGVDRYNTIGGVLYVSEEEASERHNGRKVTIIKVEWEEEQE